MAIADTITSMKTHINDAYSKISNKGGTVPSNKNLANLSSAIDTITTGGGGGSADLDALIDRSITSITNSTVTSIGVYAFYYCPKLTTVDFPNVTSIGSYAFLGCSALTTADFPNVTSIGSYAFQDCTKLTTLIIRTTSKICTLSNANAFNNSPIKTSTTSGYIYVPDDLVDSYKSATNWSTYASKIKGLSEL